MSKMKFKMLMLALPVSVMGADKQLAQNQIPAGQPNAAAQQPLVQPANPIVQAVVANPPIQPVVQQPNQPGDAKQPSCSAFSSASASTNPAPQPAQDAAHQQQQAPQPEANTSSAQWPAQQEQRKPYYRNSEQIVINCEFFYDEKDAQRKAEFISVMNSFIAESDQLLKKCDALQRFNSYYNERITKVKEIAENQAKGDETLKEKMIKALTTTLNCDPQLTDVSKSYRKLYDYDVASVRTSNETLQKKVEGLEKDVKQKDTEIEAWKKQLEDSKKETTDTKDALTRSEAEAANWRQKMLEADQLLSQQKQQINELTRKAADSSKDVDRLNKELKEAVDTNRANELKNKDLEKDLEIEQLNHQHDNEKNGDEIKKLVAQIKAMKDQLAAQKDEFEKKLLDQQKESKKQLAEQEQAYLALLAQEKEAAYNRGKVEAQNLFQQIQAMITSAQQPAILAPQPQAQDQSNNADSQGSNTTDEHK